MLLGTHFRIQDHKKVKFPGQDVSSLAVKVLVLGKIAIISYTSYL